MDNCASFSLWWKAEGFLFRWVWATVQNSLCWKGEGSHLSGSGHRCMVFLGRVRDFCSGGCGHLYVVFLGMVRDLSSSGSGYLCVVFLVLEG